MSKKLALGLMLPTSELVTWASYFSPFGLEKKPMSLACPSTRPKEENTKHGLYLA